MSRHSELAMHNFRNGFTCSQSIMLAFEDITHLDRRTALKIASSFGGGMGRLRECCGAVTASFAILGIVYGFDEPGNDKLKAEHYARVQELGLAFKGKYGTYTCRELISSERIHDAPEPEPRTEEYYRKRKCAEYIGYAAELLDRYLERNGIPDEN